jgi:hypothetical protein
LNLPQQLEYFFFYVIDFGLDVLECGFLSNLNFSIFFIFFFHFSFTWAILALMSSIVASSSTSIVSVSPPPRFTFSVKKIKKIEKIKKQLKSSASLPPPFYLDNFFLLGAGRGLVFCSLLYR